MVEDVISNAVVSNDLRFDRVSILHRLRPCALISSLGKICQGTAERYLMHVIALPAAPVTVVPPTASPVPATPAPVPVSSTPMSTSVLAPPHLLRLELTQLRLNQRVPGSSPGAPTTQSSETRN